MAKNGDEEEIRQRFEVGAKEFFSKKLKKQRQTRKQKMAEMVKNVNVGLKPDAFKDGLKKGMKISLT